MVFGPRALAGMVLSGAVREPVGAAIDPSFWRGRRVLLTGHTGFKGSWAAMWLYRLGARLTGLALPADRDPNLHGLAALDDILESHLVDLRDRDAVAAVVAGRDFDIVLHMAAQPLVRVSLEDPVGTLATNVMGTAHLLDALRGQQTLEAILVVTSDKVYANAETGRPFAEADPLGGKDPYSASKAAAEIVTASFAKSFFDRAGVRLATARAGNVVGGGDFSRDRLVADVLRAVKAGQPPRLRHPEATRPWQHVLDCVAGYLVYLQALAVGNDVPASLNFGPKPGGAPVTVASLAEAALDAADMPRSWIHDPDPRSIEARALAIDATLSRDSLGFTSRLDAAQAVRLTVAWHRALAAGQNARAVSLDQVASYERLR